MGPGKIKNGALDAQSAAANVAEQDGRNGYP
jgi:hypothetical protein